MNKDDIASMIEDCMNRESKLSEWEITFIQSLDEQFTKKGSITDKQWEKLDKIWERIT